MKKALLFGLLGLIVLPGCNVEVEGDEAGECDDGVDNDQDGALDCRDDGCAIASVCTGDDDDASDDDDDDSAADDDDSAADDDDSAGDDDDDSAGPLVITNYYSWYECTYGNLTYIGSDQPLIIGKWYNISYQWPEPGNWLRTMCRQVSFEGQRADGSLPWNDVFIINSGPWDDCSCQ